MGLGSMLWGQISAAMRETKSQGGGVLGNGVAVVKGVQRPMV